MKIKNINHQRQMDKIPGIITTSRIMWGSSVFENKN